MNQYSPAQLTLAKSRVILTTETNKLLVELLTDETVDSLPSDDDLDKIEEEVGYKLFKLDRQMNKVARKLAARKKNCTQVFVMTDSQTITLDVNLDDDTVGDLKAMIQVRYTSVGIFVNVNSRESSSFQSPINESFMVVNLYEKTGINYSCITFKKIQH